MKLGGRKSLSPLGVFLLFSLLPTRPPAPVDANRSRSTCGLALRRISPSPPPVESQTLFSFSEAHEGHIAVKFRRLVWFEPDDDLEHDLALRLAGGTRLTAGYSARGHAVAFLCSTEGPFQVECLTHQRTLFTGFVLDGDWITTCDSHGCRFDVLPDGDYSSSFWTSSGKREKGPVIHFRDHVFRPGAINGYVLREGETD